MLLSTKQFRHYTLALLLASGKPVDADDIYDKLSCSGPTLTRALKELRETYNAEIRLQQKHSQLPIDRERNADAKSATPH